MDETIKEVDRLIATCVHLQKHTQKRLDHLEAQEASLSKWGYQSLGQRMGLLQGLEEAEDYLLQVKQLLESSKER